MLQIGRFPLAFALDGSDWIFLIAVGTFTKYPKYDATQEGFYKKK